MTWRKYIILHKPESVIGEAAAHHGTPMLSYKLTEVIGVDDMRLYAGSGQSSRPVESPDHRSRLVRSWPPGLPTAKAISARTHSRSGGFALPCCSPTQGTLAQY